MQLTNWVEKFPWESEAQKKAFRGFALWLKRLPVLSVCADGVDSRLRCLAAFLFQKEHDAEEWRTKTMGDHIRRLEDEIKNLSDRLDRAETLHNGR